jgi:hypothetical protein
MSSETVIPAPETADVTAGFPYALIASRLFGYGNPNSPWHNDAQNIFSFVSQQGVLTPLLRSRPRSAPCSKAAMRRSGGAEHRHGRADTGEPIESARELGGYLPDALRIGGPDARGLVAQPRSSSLSKVDWRVAGTGSSTVTTEPYWLPGRSGLRSPSAAQDAVTAVRLWSAISRSSRACTTSVRDSAPRARPRVA